MTLLSNKNHIITNEERENDENMDFSRKPKSI